MPALGRHLAKYVDNSLGPRYKQRGGDFLQHVDVYDFLETLGMENIQRGSIDELLFSCPFPGHSSGDSKPSAYMNDGSREKSKTTVWKCHGCGRAGNAVTFLSEHEGVSKHEAALHIRQTWAPNFRAPRGGSISAEFEQRIADRLEQSRRNDDITVIEWSEYGKRFGVDWDDAERTYHDQGDRCDPAVSYLFGRGFSARTLTAWRIGYDAISERFTIPVCNAQGELIGVKGRAWSKEQKNKYRIIGDKPNKRPRYGFIPYEKSRFLFGAHMLAGAKHAVMVEGELDVLALWQIGVPAVCTGSASVSDVQLVQIRDSVDSLTIYFDNDEAGNNGVWGYEDKHGDWHPGLVERLEPFLRLRVVIEPPTDPAELVRTQRESELRALLDDARAHHFAFLA